MPTELHLWRWIITCDITGKRIKTTWHMIEADALERDPMAEKIPDTHEVRRAAANTSDWQRGQSPANDGA